MVKKTYEQGFEDAKQAAIQAVSNWHVAKWNDQPTLNQEEVHGLLSCIAGDIEVLHLGPAWKPK